MQSIYRFIGVSDTFTQSAALQFGASGVPKSRIVHNGLKILNNPSLKFFIRQIFPEKFRQKVFVSIHNKNVEKPPLPEAAKLRLIKEFRKDINQLEKLIRRDLSGWLM